MHDILLDMHTISSSENWNTENALWEQEFSLVFKIPCAISEFLGSIPNSPAPDFNSAARQTLGQVRMKLEQLGPCHLYRRSGLSCHPQLQPGSVLASIRMCEWSLSSLLLLSKFSKTSGLISKTSIFISFLELLSKVIRQETKISRSPLKIFKIYYLQT